jgi:hypothetical protein
MPPTILTANAHLPLHPVHIEGTHLSSSALAMLFGDADVRPGIVSVAAMAVDHCKNALLLIFGLNLSTFHILLSLKILRLMHRLLRTKHSLIPFQL